MAFSHSLGQQRRTLNECAASALGVKAGSSASFNLGFSGKPIRPAGRSVDQNSVAAECGFFKRNGGLFAFASVGTSRRLSTLNAVYGVVDLYADGG